MSGNTAQVDVAIVSGGTTGIGLAIVRELRANGLAVGLFSSSKQKVKDAEILLGEEPGPPYHVAVVDVASSAEVVAFHEAIEAKLGRVGTLVCNAGISPKHNGQRTSIHETSDQEWNGTFDINLSGTFHCIKACVPSMLAENYGRIVLIGSIASRIIPRMAGAAYVASKSALSGIMRSVISEYGDFGVTCNIVAPGNIATSMVANKPQVEIDAIVSRIPAGRLGTPSDIAQVVSLLCRPTSDFISGAIIDVTGGEFAAS